MITNGLNLVWPWQAWVETHRLFSNEKVLNTIVSKEGQADSLLGYERCNQFGILEKVNSASIFQLLKQKSPYSWNDSCT